MISLFIEAFVVGILIVVIGSIISFVIGRLLKTDLPPVCKDWNKNRVMEICLFLTGFITHLIFEACGANRWYCKNGYACKST
jgi:hypothetical protein|tara:strand:- start:1848 stop:2093 length:246 start_codon:yes stop_codon:yes gene_type:complete